MLETDTETMSLRLTVQFVEMSDRYPSNEDLECKYTFNNYEIQDGDRIALFKMGWKSLRNYVLFEWAVASPKADVHSINFTRYDLPSGQGAMDELYQFCYISGENVVQGISTPFQIYSVAPKPSIITDSIAESDKNSHLKRLLSLRDKEILNLKEENAVLKESLKSLVEQRKPLVKNYDQDIESLKQFTQDLKNALVSQQKEIESMKSEMKRDKAAFKQLQLEKIIAERKFSAVIKKEPSSVRRMCNFELGKLEPIPAFPLD